MLCDQSLHFFPTLVPTFGLVDDPLGDHLPIFHIVEGLLLALGLGSLDHFFGLHFFRGLFDVGWSRVGDFVVIGPLRDFGGRQTITDGSIPETRLSNGELAGDLHFPTAESCLTQSLDRSGDDLTIHILDSTHPLALTTLADAVLEICEVELFHVAATIRFVVGSLLAERFVLGEKDLGVENLSHGWLLCARGGGW